MKPRIRPLVAVLPVLFMLYACQPGKKAQGLISYIDSLEAVYAPDSRVAIWDLDIQASGNQLSLEGELTSPEAFQLIIEKAKSDFPGAEIGLTLLPEDDKGLLVTGLVNNSVIHLRKGPSSKTEMVTQTMLGFPVRILKEGKGKYLVQVPDGYIGYVNIPEVTALDAESHQVYREAEKVIFMKQYGFVYAEKDCSSQAVGDLVVGNLLVKVEEDGDFVRVRYPDMREGWVLKEELMPALEVYKRQPTGEDLVKTALRFHGIPYLWGGTSAKMIDCSGLVSNVYYLNGIQLPRDADPQSRCGRLLTTEYVYDDLLPGDLLFWGRKATTDSPERITHVGMYIGDGEFIHSAGYHERVSINSMDPEKANYITDYPKIFVRSVRILGEEGGFGPVPENPLFKDIIQP